MKNELIAKAGMALTKFGTKTKVHSPEILLVAGIAGTIGTVILACVATRKVDDILVESKEKIDEIHATSVCEDSVYTSKEQQKDLVKVYAKAGWDFAKLYGPTFVTGTLSIYCLISSHRIMKDRNESLAAAYTTMYTAFKQYRDRVSEKIGADAEKEIRYAVEKQKVEEVTTDENGKQKKLKKTVEIAAMPSGYARFFDECSREYIKEPYMNLTFLRGKQAALNNLLQSRYSKSSPGYVFLNEVYRELDIGEPTQEGQIVGWYWTPEHPSVIDFGIYDTNRHTERFVNGYERSILLDFNVDGIIIDKL
jgi:hypothetical protein